MRHRPPVKTNQRTMVEKIKQLLLYCIIGVAVSAAAISLGILQAKAGSSAGLPIKWLGFAIMTALVFGNAIRYSKSRWTRPKFWGLLALFLFLHLAVGLAALWRLTQVGLIQFFLATVIEISVLSAYLGRFLSSYD
jgi:hypothetical protein